MLEKIIHSLHFEDIQSADHPSDFIVKDPYNILILRLPIVQNDAIESISYAFVFHEDQAYLYNRDKGALQEFGSLGEINDFLDAKIEALLKKLKWYHYEIEKLEDMLYDNTYTSDFMEKWLTYKKNSALIYRLMYHATLSLELFIAHHKRIKSRTFEEIAYADLQEHMQRSRDLSQDIVDRLDHLYDFYRAKVDEKMNRNVYYLTLLSGIFLPLTLMTGFFGMNTGGLPWTQDPDGTWKVIGISLILEAIFFLPFYLLNRKKRG